MAETYEITSSPVAALFGACLIVGVEREADALRVYVGARYRGIYVVLPAGEVADGVEAAWNGWSSHLFLRPVPPPEALFTDVPE